MPRPPRPGTDFAACGLWLDQGGHTEMWNQREDEQNEDEDERQSSVATVGEAQTVHQPAKLIRIASMIRELLEEVRRSGPDEPGRKRLREVYERAVAALREG